jgi:hypothetical protein
LRSASVAVIRRLSSSSVKASSVVLGVSNSIIEDISARTWTPEERFSYFRSKLCRSALWSEPENCDYSASNCSGNTLFDLLQGAARARMMELGTLCDTRFRALLEEPGAELLLAEETLDGKLHAFQGNDARPAEIFRQDHPKVTSLVVGISV